MGLHTFPMLLMSLFGGAAAVAVVVAVCIRRKVAELVMVACLLMIIGGVPAIISELGFDSRDAAVRVRLGYADIDVLGYRDWDRNVVVRAPGGCTAVYKIVPSVNRHTEGWPLVAGTGRSLRGSCTKKELDGLFMRTAYHFTP